MKRRVLLASESAAIGTFEIFFDGDSRHGIPWTLRPDARVGYSLFYFSDRLWARGWHVAA